jgi:3-phosphoglycerate kinase
MLGLLENNTIIIGGGETASLVEDKTGAIYISTGGGALLEYLQNKIINGKNLVGLDIFT